MGPKAPTATVRLPVLSTAATDAFDRYVAERDKKRSADAKARKAADAQKKAFLAVDGEMAEHDTAQLADGRIVSRK